MEGLPQESNFKRALLSFATDDDAPAAKVDVNEWPLLEQLFANVVDLLAIANWQRSGGKGSKPKLLTAGPKRSAKPDKALGDIRGLLARTAPALDAGLPDAGVE